MVSVKFLICAGAASLISSAVCAADLPPPPPYQPQIAYAPVAEVSGWYLRGDVGIGIQQYSRFDHSQVIQSFTWPATWQIVQTDIQDTTIFGAGVGYVINSWFRMDITGEYRTKAMFKGTGSYSGATCNGGTGTCFDVNTGNLSSAVFMANAYLDLGTWWCLTPYVGAGVGGAFNRITGIQDDGIISDGSVGFGFGGDNGKWDLAWNAQIGLVYNVNSNFKVDFNVRYLNLGSPQSAEVICQNTVACPGAIYQLTDTSSWDFRIGLRWMLQPEAPVVVAPPLMSRG